MFPNSLTKIAFTWYINLPPNFTHSWQAKEEQFHAQFYREEPEISIANMSKLKQISDELAESFLEMFKRLKK